MRPPRTSTAARRWSAPARSASCRSSAATASSCSASTATGTTSPRGTASPCASCRPIRRASRRCSPTRWTRSSTCPPPTRRASSATTPFASPTRCPGARSSCTSTRTASARPSSPTRPASRSTAIRSATSRVRLAVSKAINRAAIVDRVMEGFAVPASNLVSPPVFGHVAALKPEALDPEGAKKLLAEAGYPDGFGVTLHAPNNRYVNDEQIAQAVAQMLSRVGIAAKVEVMPVARVFPARPQPRLQPRDAGLGLDVRRPRAALAARMTFDADKRLGRLELGPLHQPQGRRRRRAGARHHRRREARAHRPRSRDDRAARAGHHPDPPPGGDLGDAVEHHLHAAHRRVHPCAPLPAAVAAPWLRTSPLRARHDRLHHPPAAAERRRALRDVAARVRRRVRDRQSGRPAGQPAGRPGRASSAPSPRSASTSRCGSSTCIFLKRRAAAATSAAPSSSTSRPSALILERMPATLELALAALLIAIVLGIPLGLYAGLQARLASPGAPIMAGSILGFSLPTFWVGLMLIMVFAVELGWLPSTGRGADGRPLRHPGELPHARRPAAPRAAGVQPRAVQDLAGHPPDARRHARGAAAGLREVRPRQGPVARAASSACTCSRTS